MNLRSAKSGRVGDSRNRDARNGVTKRGHSSPVSRARSETSTALAPEPPRLRFFSLRIELVENSGSVLTAANVTVPDYFLGCCVFDAVYKHAINISSPLYYIKRSETYRKREP
jgi:hypothetical protein